jgi:beta-glucanase (GH16 family)
MRHDRAVTVLASIVAIMMIGACGLIDDRGETLFEDDFDGERLDPARWNTCHWWDDGGCTIESNDELQWYVPSQVSVADGALNLIAEDVETRGVDREEFPYRSGMVTTGPPGDDSEAKFAFTFGVLEARVQAPAGDGLWAALWLLPVDRDSRPEIDLFEVLGNDPSEMIMHLHPEDRDEESPSFVYRMAPGSSFADGWRDVRLEWEHERLGYFVDGRQVWEVVGDQVPDEPMYVVANLAVGGFYPGEPSCSTRFPATYSIDYIRVRPVAP